MHILYRPASHKGTAHSSSGVLQLHSSQPFNISSIPPSSGYFKRGAAVTAGSSFSMPLLQNAACTGGNGAQTNNLCTSAVPSRLNSSKNVIMIERVSCEIRLPGSFFGICQWHDWAVSCQLCISSYLQYIKCCPTGKSPAPSCLPQWTKPLEMSYSH